MITRFARCALVVPTLAVLMLLLAGCTGDDSTYAVIVVDQRPAESSSTE